MNYEIIANYQELIRFVDFLPELEINETYYLTLMSRSKYEENSTNNRTQIVKRFTSDKENLINKIRQLECEEGSYGDLNPTTLALYINTNPRCLKKATYSMLADITGKLMNMTDFSPQSDALTAIARSKSRPEFVIFDVDRKDVLSPGFLYEIKNLLGDEAVSLIETSGGFHLLVSPKKVNSEFKNWHQKIVALLGKSLDQSGDLLSPIPGTYQGQFEVRLGLIRSEWTI